MTTELRGDPGRDRHPARPPGVRVHALLLPHAGPSSCGTEVMLLYYYEATKCVCLGGQM